MFLECNKAERVAKGGGIFALKTISHDLGHCCLQKSTTRRFSLKSSETFQRRIRTWINKPDLPFESLIWFMPQLSQHQQTVGLLHWCKKTLDLTK